jgi:putative FmdB family regulatory protein
MPTYQYQCRDCGHGFEQFQKFSDDPLTDCPTCEGTVQRVIQNVGVVFKGSGWYINDSRKPSGSNGSSDSNSGAKTDSSDSATKTSPKTESEKAPAAAGATVKSD